VHPSVVADAGGLLVLTGLLEGVRHEVDEILVLDATSLLVAEYLALRHEGAPDHARAEFGLAASAVREWYPVRPLAVETAIAAGSASDDIDGLASLALAEVLHVPLVSKNAELRSRRIPVLHC
jgi:hypothetical protein